MRNSTKKFTSTVLSFVFVAIAAGATLAQSPTSDDWTGFYVGGNAGITVGRTGVNTSTVFNDAGYFEPSSVPAINSAGARTIKSNGFTGGGQAGYNKQFGRFVVGAEADFGAFRLNKELVSGDEYPCCAGLDFEIAQSIKTNWLFTARPRVGVTAGPALLYATGGLAMTDVKYSAVFTDNAFDALETAEIKKTRTGYAAGGGVEVKMSERWSAKVEYLLTDFGRVSVTSNNLLVDFDEGDVSVPENPFTHSARVKAHSFRFGMNYRF